MARTLPPVDISVSDKPVGRLLDGRYRVEALLARGGMATVYRAVDTRLDRLVALKVMHPELAADDGFVARFIGEARSAARLSDPNVVNVFDQGEDDGAVFLAMEYVEGRTLRAVLQESGRLGASLALDVAESVLSALDAAHRAGIVHRDVKPENVLVGDDGRVKVADFGLARAVSSSSKTTRGLLGTVNYISPEQALGEKATTRSDVYSAGIMLYELLTGQPPHDGATDFVVVRCHIDEDVQPPSALAPVPAVVDELVLTSTSRDPDGRYTDSGEFLAAVRSAQAQLGGRENAGFGAGVSGHGDSHNAESRDSAGVSMNEALTGAVLAGNVVSEDGAEDDAGAHEDPSEFDDASVVADAGTEDADSFDAESDDADRAADSGYVHTGFAGFVGFGAARTNDTQDDLAHPSNDKTPPPPPPPSSSHTRVIGAGSTATGEDQPESQAPPQPDAAESAAGTAGATTHRRRRRIVILVLVLLLAASVAVGAWWYTSGRWDSTPSLLEMPAEEANDAAEDAGFTVSQSGEEFSEDVPAGHVIGTEPEPGERILDGEEITYVLSKGPERYEVPSLNGMTLDEAEQAAADVELGVIVSDERYNEEVPEGKIITQNVDAGEQVKRDTEISVVLSQGPQPIEIQDFTGSSREDAEATLSEAGLEVNVSEEFSDTVDAGAVISQEPSSGTAFKGDTIDLVVSRGSEMVDVPAIIGTEVGEAEQTLKDAGFAVEVVDLLDGPDRGQEPRVVRLDPAGATHPRGTTITIYHF